MKIPDLNPDDVSFLHDVAWGRAFFTFGPLRAGNRNRDASSHKLRYGLRFPNVGPEGRFRA